MLQCSLYRGLSLASLCAIFMTILGCGDEEAPSPSPPAVIACGSGIHRCPDGMVCFAKVCETRVDNASQCVSPREFVPGFNICIEPSCDNSIKDGDEVETDCGGVMCAPCESCRDGVQNQDEQGVDCGGSICEPCRTCDDGVQNQGEQGIDCGGPCERACPRCGDGIVQEGELCDGEAGLEAFSCADRKLGLGVVECNRLCQPSYAGCREIQSIGAGGEHTCAFVERYGFSCWGHNKDRQLGHDDSRQSWSPTKVSLSGPFDRVSALDGGVSHTCLLADNGYVYCWGDNRSFQVNYSILGDTASITRMEDVWGVAQIALGATHTCARTMNGIVYCWGNNDYGLLGAPASFFNYHYGLVAEYVATDLVAGHWHNCYADSSGDVYCWGNNEFGQLNHEGLNSISSPALVQGVARSVMLSAGAYHTCSLSVSGEVHCWGANHYGQLGRGDAASAPGIAKVVALNGVVELTSGAFHSCARVQEGDVYCWGNASSGQLGYVEDDGQSYMGWPKKVAGLPSPAKALSAGNAHTCALLDDNSIHCWGANSGGQLGRGNSSFYTEPVDVDGVEFASAVYSGDYRSCVLNDASLYCWGERIFDVDGVHPLAPNSTPKAHALGARVRAASIGEHHSCAVTEAGAVWCWGANNNYQLGDGTKTSQGAPKRVEGLAAARQVAVNDLASCALLEDGAVYCWGYLNAAIPYEGQAHHAMQPTLIPALQGVKQLALGYEHGLALTHDDRVLGWGKTAGQLGNVHMVLRVPTPLPLPEFVEEIVAAGDKSCVRTAQGQVYCWGYWSGFYIVSEPVVIDVGQAKQIALGWRRGCAVNALGEVYCWGEGGFGVASPTGFDIEPRKIPGLNEKAVSVSAGTDHACAVLESGRAKCWGLGDAGRLGNAEVAKAYSTPSPVIWPKLETP